MSEDGWKILATVIFAFFIGLAVGSGVVAAQINGNMEDCEKNLPRTQECTLQWVKPEVSK